MAAKRAVSAAGEARRPRDKNGVLEVPQGLIDAIAEGQCIAFVGAGFSGAARLPGWAALLEGILKKGLEDGKIPEGKRELIQSLIDEGTSGSFDQAAQIMDDYKAPVAEVVKEKLTPPDELPPAMKERLRLLFGIPFNAIVTTNFDFFLPGIPAAHDDAKPVMRRILRDPPLTMIEQLVRQVGYTMKSGAGDYEDFAAMMGELQEQTNQETKDLGDEGEVADEEIEVIKAMDNAEIPIIQLHGTVAEDKLDKERPDGAVPYLEDPGLAFTRLGYRRLLHGNAAYQAFLQAVMATKTILYIGFSFSDEYINELRSGTMMMLQGAGLVASEEEVEENKETPIAYAIMLSEKQGKIDFYHKHEGVEILNYIPEEGQGFEGLETWLKAIYLKTNPLYRWSQCLHGKRFLLCSKGDPAMAVMGILKFVENEFAESCGDVTVCPVPEEGEEATQEQFNQKMLEYGAAFDLIVVGWKTNGHPTAKLMLGAQDSLPTDLKSPVLVVESVEDDEETDIKIRSLMIPRRSAAFKMGAAGYACNMKGLFTQIQNILKKPVAYENECTIL